MIKFRIIYIFATTAIISAKENDQLTASNKNINLYLVPPSELKPFISKPKQAVYRDSGIQYEAPVPAYPVLKSEQSDHRNIALQVLNENQEPYVVQPRYNALSYSQSQPKVEFRNQEDPNTKFALEPEGPNETKVTVKVIKEHKKTFAVDPSYIENKPSVSEYSKPEVIYKTVEAAYPNSETAYQESDPGYTKYIIKKEEPKEKNVFVKVVEEDKHTFVADPKYNNDNTYYQQPEYRTIETVYKNSEPRYVIKEEEPRQKDIIVKVLKEDKNSFEINPSYKSNNAESDYRQILTKYRKSESEPVKYEVKREEPQVLIKIVKEDKNKLADRRDNSYLEPVYKKLVTEYRKSEPEYRTSELNFKKYKDKEEDQDKHVFVKVVKEDKNTFAIEPKYKNDKKYLEPVYRKSVTEYRKSEPEYRKSETDYDKFKDNEDKEKKVFVKVVREEKKIFDVNPKYENEHKYSEPDYKKSVTEYEETEPQFRMLESDYDKYEEKKTKEKKYVKVVDEDKKTIVDDLKFRDDKTYFEPEYKKSIAEQEKPEQEYRKSESDFNKYEDKDQESKIYEDEKNYFEQDHGKFESEYRKSEPGYKQIEADYDRYEDNDEESKSKKVLIKVIKEEENKRIDVDQNNENGHKYETDTKNKNDEKYDNDHKYLEPEYRKFETGYKESESKSKNDGNPNHDVLIKIWSKKSN